MGTYTNDFYFFKSADFLNDFHQRLLSSMLDKISGIQRFFLKDLHFHVLIQLDIISLGLDMPILMH